MERLNMSLEQIIAHRDKQRNSQGSHSNTNSSNSNSRTSVRGRQGNRSSRQQQSIAPYSQQQQPPSFSSRNSRRPTSSVSSDPSPPPPLSNIRRDPAALKFLLSNYFAGIFIGNGGSSIREMEQICDASVHISNAADCYPGSKDRVVFMSGTEPAVTLAQSLMWEMIGQQTFAEIAGKGPLLWNPSRAKESPGQYDDITVEGKITIPAASAGTIIGRGGNTVKALAAESGVEVTLDAKEDADFTQERIVTIAGTVASCMNFTSMILHRLTKNNEAVYLVNGTTYPKRSAFGSRPAAGGLLSTSAEDHHHSHHHISSSNSVSNYSNYRARPGDGEMFDPNIKTSVCAETLSAFTTIELSIPDSIIGGILGPHGATLNEIIALSGAKVNVSKRGDFIEGTSNRLVTITGSPPCSQTAHTLIIHKLRQAIDGY